MKFLLDTQIFIWWDSDSDKLPPRFLEVCQNPEHTLILSIASLWEIQIKTQLGKLDLSRPLNQIVDEQTKTNQFVLLPIESAHILGLQQLPFYHKDPFDRLLISQAIIENLTILTVDSLFSQYPITVYAE